MPRIIGKGDDLSEKRKRGFYGASCTSRNNRSSMYYLRTMESEEQELYGEDEIIRKNVAATIGHNVFSNSYRNLFGKTSYLSTSYTIDETSYQILCAVFHTSIKNISWIGQKLSSELMGIGSAGLVTLKLCQMQYYSKILPAYIKNSRMPAFTLLGEVGFKVPQQHQAPDFVYNVGVFSAYCYFDIQRQLEYDYKSAVYDNINKIRNYIGIKGIGKKNKDAFVIVTVNDSVDLLRFCDACIKCGITQSEIERLFFTSEAIVNRIGLDYLIKMKSTERDSQSGSVVAYELDMARLPIM